MSKNSSFLQLAILGVFFISNSVGANDAAAPLRIPASRYSSVENFPAEHGEGKNLEPCSEGGENVAWIRTGSKLIYDFELPAAGTYTVRLRAAALKQGKVHFVIDSGGVKGLPQEVSTGGFQNWTSLDFPAVDLSQGKHRLTVVADKGGFNLEFIEFVPGNVAAHTAAEKSAEIRPAETTAPAAKSDSERPKRSFPPIKISAASQAYVRAPKSIRYDFQVPQTGKYSVEFKVSAIETGIFHYIIDSDSYVSPAQTVSSGGNSVTKRFPDISLRSGRHSIQIIAIQGGIKFESATLTFGE